MNVARHAVAGLRDVGLAMALQGRDVVGLKGVVYLVLQPVIKNSKDFDR